MSQLNEDANKLFVDDYECDYWPEEYIQEVYKSKEYKFLEKQYDDYVEEEIKKQFDDYVEEELKKVLEE